MSDNDNEPVDYEAAIKMINEAKANGHGYMLIIDKKVEADRIIDGMNGRTVTEAVLNIFETYPGVKKATMIALLEEYI